jgi:uncharacterized protein
MLLVKTRVDKSKIEGLGLFSDQFIPKGTITWRFNPQFDIYFDPADVEKMPEMQRDLIIHFAYLSKKSGKYVYSIDNTRFTNHSSNPNIDNSSVLKGDVEVCGIAKKDIEIGEEMTIDYRIIESGNEEYLR